MKNAFKFIKKSEKKNKFKKNRDQSQLNGYNSVNNARSDLKLTFSERKLNFASNPLTFAAPLLFEYKGDSERTNVLSLSLAQKVLTQHFFPADIETRSR